MDIAVTGRRTEVTDRFRRHAEEKLAKVEQLANRVQRVEVRVEHAPNPRQADHSERVEITVMARGKVARAEAAASDQFAALDLALGKLSERLRREHDRRQGRYRNARQNKAADLAVDLGAADLGAVVPPEPEILAAEPEVGLRAPEHPGEAVEAQLGDSPVVVRQKVHDSTPMSVDEALAEMELVGHPFFLFIDSETRQPCVVYHRHGWTYGVIRLNVEASA